MGPPTPGGIPLGPSARQVDEALIAQRFPVREFQQGPDNARAYPPPLAFFSLPRNRSTPAQCIDRRSASSSRYRDGLRFAMLRAHTNVNDQTHQIIRTSPQRANAHPGPGTQVPRQPVAGRP